MRDGVCGHRSLACRVRTWNLIDQALGRGCMDSVIDSVVQDCGRGRRVVGARGAIREAIFGMVPGRDY